VSSEDTNTTQTTVTVVDKLKKELPEILGQAQVVGQWIWLEFTSRPSRPVRAKLKELGFHWNKRRRCWQHPCGTRAPNDPRENGKYAVSAATELKINDAPVRAPKYVAKEFKLVTIRDFPLPESLRICDTPDKAADYWRQHVTSCPYFNSECECFVVLMLSTRRHIKGHQLVSIGTLDTILVHPREVFRIAVIAGASAVVVMHNHPSGDPTPSDSDVKATRDLIRAGQLLKIDVLDHVILGQATQERPKDWTSLRELGFFL
jgi:hypothetical protein